MSEAVQTLEGWYCLHDFRTINWPLWKSLSENERETAIREFQEIVNQWEVVHENKEGSHAFYSVVGQKQIFYL